MSLRIFTNYTMLDHLARGYNIFHAQVNMQFQLLINTKITETKNSPPFPLKYGIYEGHPKCSDNDPIKQNLFSLGCISSIFTFYLEYGELNPKFKYFPYCNR